MTPAGHPKIADTFENLLLNYSILQHITHNSVIITSNFRVGLSTNSHHHRNKETSTSETENIFLILENLQRCAYPVLVAFQQFITETTCNTEINGIPSKIKNVFLDQNFSLNKDTHFCSQDSKHALRINFRFSFKRKERTLKALIWQILRKQVFCGVNTPIYFTLYFFQERNHENEGNYPN